MVGEEVVDSALLFPTGGVESDFQRQLTSVVSISDAEDGSEATVSEVFFDVELVANFSTQQLGFECVDVRCDGHRFCLRSRGRYVCRRGGRCKLEQRGVHSQGSQEAAFYTGDERGLESPSGWSRR